MSASPIAALPDLTPRALATLTGRSPCPVKTYRAIAAAIASVDLRSECAEPVRRKFNAYYGVRRNAAWREAFYARFEAAKQSPLTGVDLFADIVRGIEADTGRVEASFISKLVATLDPERPIIDSVVRRWLAPLTLAPPFHGSIDAVIIYYQGLNEIMTDLALTPQARAWSAAFDAAFPTPRGQSAIPAMKRLDFLIWAGAER